MIHTIMINFMYVKNIVHIYFKYSHYTKLKILMENFDSCDEHCFYIKFNTAIILVFTTKLVF